MDRKTIARNVCDAISISISEMIKTNDNQDLKNRVFPLSLEYELATELDQCAKDMNLTKTALSKIAIKKLLVELQKSGARNYMKELTV